MRIWLMSVLLPVLAACQKSSPPNALTEIASVSGSSVAATAFSTAVTLPSDQSSSLAETMPADVQAFMDKRDECDHWRGEEPYDDDRAKEITNAINDTCTGTDQKLAGLRDKYKDREAVIKALAYYEDRIEN